MKHITSTAVAAGARGICAESVEESLPGMGSISQQPVFRPVLRREIMAAVNTCSRDLGLRQGAVVVLDALLSCLPCQGADGREAPVAPSTLLTVYASNETLCFRAKGLTDRQLRRHLETLENAGLLRRRDSANGKRFPVMQHGKPIGAFGLDLSPLFTRADELLALALRRREEAEELRGIRAQILRLRAACANLRLDDAHAAFVDGLRNLVRRTTLTLVEARAALAQLTAVLSRDTGRPVPETVASAAPTSTTPTEVEIPLAEPDAEPVEERAVEPAFAAIAVCNAPALQPLETDKTPASDGQDVRHIEQDSHTKKREAGEGTAACWSDLTEVSAFHAEPKNAREATIIAFEFGRMLKISRDLLANAATRLGLWELLRLEDRMAREIGSILNPDAYLRKVLRS